jgi:hypothetical protein
MTRWTALGALCVLLVLPSAAGAQSSPPAASPPAAASGKAGSAGITKEEYVINAKAHAAKLANRRFDAIDTGHKGVVTRDQYVTYYEGRSAQFASRRFDQIDKDHNGVIEQSELDAWKAAHRRTRSASATTPAAK